MNDDDKQQRRPATHRKRGARPSRNPAPLLRQPRQVRGQLCFNLSKTEQKGDEPGKK